MNPYGMSCGVNPVTSTDALYSSYTPNVKLEYPMCMQSSQYGGLPSSIPASTNGIYSSIQSTVPTSSAKQVRPSPLSHTHTQYALSETQGKRPEIVSMHVALKS